MPVSNSVSACHCLYRWHFTCEWRKMFRSVAGGRHTRHGGATAVGQGGGHAALLSFRSPWCGVHRSPALRSARITKAHQFAEKERKHKSHRSGRLRRPSHRRAPHQQPALPSVRLRGYKVRQHGRVPAEARGITAPLSHLTPVINHFRVAGGSNAPFNIANTKNTAVHPG